MRAHNAASPATKPAVLLQPSHFPDADARSDPLRRIHGSVSFAHHAQTSSGMLLGGDLVMFDFDVRSGATTRTHAPTSANRVDLEGVSPRQLKCRGRHQGTPHPAVRSRDTLRLQSESHRGIRFRRTDNPQARA